MEVPSKFIDTMNDLHFSTKLRRIIKRLFNENYDVSIHIERASFPITIDPLHIGEILHTRIHKDGMEPVTENFICNITNYKLAPINTIKETYDNLADAIYNKIFATADKTKSRVLTVSTEEVLFIKNLKKELDSRGDFTVDIPKFVDVLFKLGVMIPKEDVETPESNESTAEGDELVI